MGVLFGEWVAEQHSAIEAWLRELAGKTDAPRSNLLPAVSGTAIVSAAIHFGLTLSCDFCPTHQEPSAVSRRAA